MKKVAIVLFSGVMVFFFAMVAAAGPEGGPKSGCGTIPQGEVLTSGGDVIEPGFDEFGYNYQAHIFNGRYCDSDRVLDGPSCDVSLIMQWSDEWLSNSDCDGDTLLDRGWDGSTVSGTSMGWLTNHQSGSYEQDGSTCYWTYFVKIVFVGPPPPGDDPWAGRRIWGQYAIIQEVSNDPCVGVTGLLDLVNPAGFGFWTK